MMARFREWWKSRPKQVQISPRGFLRRAVELLVIFLVCHAAGLREYTSIISVTSPSGGKADTLCAVLGCVYGVVYFLCVLVAPILVLASGIFWLLQYRVTPVEIEQKPEHGYAEAAGERS